MTDFDMEDSLTKLNTQLNKSMVLMDAIETETSQRRSNKSIKINTKNQRTSLLNNLPISRKSILKRPEKRNVVEAENNEETLSETNDSRLSLNVSTVRPHNPKTNLIKLYVKINRMIYNMCYKFGEATISDLVQQEDLIVETTDTTCDLDDLSDSEDIWIMDIPGTVNPQELKGQTLVFGEKSKFKINKEKYYAVNHEVKCNVTCVFHTGKMKSRYKTVNMKPAGTITVRRKLSNVSKIKPMLIENCNVPFPKNLRTRHPLFGVDYKGNIGIVQ